MTANRDWIICAAIFLSVGSATDDQLCQGTCETSVVQAVLGTSAVLSCSFERGSQGPASGGAWVLWTQGHNSSLVNITSQLKVQFLDHRNGRVKVFPIQWENGSYSVRVDELQSSDLGCYRCEQRDSCKQVNLTELQRGVLEANMHPLIYFTSGLSFLILLLSAGFCCYNCNKRLCVKRSADANSSVSITDASDLPVEQVTRKTPYRERGRSDDRHVYENSDHDPSLSCHNQANVVQHHPPSNPSGPAQIEPNFTRNAASETTGRQGRQQRIHRELISRLRQASISRHFYVNQDELHQRTPSSQTHTQQRGRKFENPIYDKQLNN